MSLYDITVSKLNRNEILGKFGTGWNISVKCQVHKDVYTDIWIAVADPVKVSTALQKLPEKYDLIKNTIEDGVVSATYTGNIDIELFRRDMMAYGELTEEDIPEESITSEVTEKPVRDDVEPEIFVFQAVDPADPILDKDMFSNIATLYDILTIPVGEPVQLTGQPYGYENIPYYRLDHVEMIFLTADEAEMFIRTTKKCVRGLVREYEALDKYSLETTELI